MKKKDVVDFLEELGNGLVGATGYSCGRCFNPRNPRPSANNDPVMRDNEYRWCNYCRELTHNRKDTTILKPASSGKSTDNMKVEDIYDAFGELMGIESVGEMTWEEIEKKYPEVYKKIHGTWKN